MSTPTLRVWQQQAQTELFSQWKIPGFKPLVVACPGAGKTIFAASSAIHALKEYDIELVVVVAPGNNIKFQWKDAFNKVGIKAHSDANNESLNFRLKNGVDPTDGWRAICVTYAQLAADSELFPEIARRKRTLIIADEIHHADDTKSYGVALEKFADNARLRLALSGTPFRTDGGALAMCNVENIFNADGKIERWVKPIYTYTYKDALKDGGVVRPVEFVKITGKSTTTLRHIESGELSEKVVDLDENNKDDQLSALLDPDGEFMINMVKEALSALTESKKGDRNAGMLVVAKDKDHGARLTKLIRSLASTNSDWENYQVIEVYNDTANAHNRIRQLERDGTDIVVSVKMISEGVDIKRLKVGLYASNSLTRMFFVQFVGRFVRWDSNLKSTQFAKVVFPGHVILNQYAKEIEDMVLDAITMKDEKKDDVITPPPPPPTHEVLGVQTEVGSDSVIYRSDEDSARDTARVFFMDFPHLAGIVTETDAIKMHRLYSKGDTANPQPKPQYEEDWGMKNQQVTAKIVSIRKKRGEDEAKAYADVNKLANQVVGIKRKDKMTPPDVLKKRYEYLVDTVLQRELEIENPFKSSVAAA